MPADFVDTDHAVHRNTMISHFPPSRWNPNVTDDQLARERALIVREASDSLIDQPLPEAVAPSPAEACTGFGFEESVSSPLRVPRGSTPFTREHRRRTLLGAICVLSPVVIGLAFALWPVTH